MARGVTGHNGHVLQMTLSTFVADWAIVRMILHQALNNRSAKVGCFPIFDGESRSIYNRSHAGHDKLSSCILLVSKLLYRALATCSYRSKYGMPAEIRHIIA